MAPPKARWTFQPQPMTVAADGTGHGEIVIRDGGTKVATLRFTLTDWRHLRIDATNEPGHVGIDGIEAWLGER